jgi:drug/metabolite transporter (DMT)-like permease
MSTRGATAGLLVCVGLWGAVFVAVHELLPELDPIQMVTLRFIGVSAFFAVLLALRPDWRPHFTRRDWPLVIVAGILAVAGSQLPIVDGQRFLSPPIASLIVTFAPAVAAVLAALVTREKLTVH